MKKRVLTLALTGSTLLLAACGGDDDRLQDAANPLLDLVPADTPFVMANLEPIPSDVVDAYLARANPVMMDMQSSLQQLQYAMDDGSIDRDDEASAALLEAVLAELDGNMNRAGLESMGFSLESYSVFYGHGLFPVMRAGIADAELVRAMVSRVETRSGQSVPQLDFQGVDYWRFADAGMPMALYLAILDDHIVMTAAPPLREAEFLPALLAVEQPAASLADSGALIDLAREKDYSPYLAGYMDLSVVLDEMFDPGSVTAQWMGDMGEFDLAAIDPACEREARLITAAVPRLVMGATEITADRIGMQYQVETNRLIGAQLAKLVADVPQAASGGPNMVNASMSLNMGAVVQFLRDSANVMAEVPFECPQLRNMNGQIEQMATTLNQPMPPFIGNLKGFRAALLEVDPAAMQPENMRGMLSLEMESPQMVIGMASMMVPGFEDLQIEPGADPVELPQDLMMIATPEMEIYAVMSNDAIGVSMGKGQKDQLRGFLDADGKSESVFFSVEYDMAMLAELQAAGQSWAHADNGSGADVDYGTDPDIEQLMDNYQAFLGRSRFELHFDGSGLTIENVQTFQ